MRAWRAAAALAAAARRRRSFDERGRFEGSGIAPAGRTGVVVRRLRLRCRRPARAACVSDVPGDELARAAAVDALQLTQLAPAD